MVSYMNKSLHFKKRKREDLVVIIMVFNIYVVKMFRIQVKSLH